MASIDVNAQAITITITDPVELERLMLVLTRTKSTKVQAIRQQLVEAIDAAAVTEVITDEVVDTLHADIVAFLVDEA